MCASHCPSPQLPLIYRNYPSMYVDNLQPGESLPYAWDEPNLLDRIRVQVRWWQAGRGQGG